jgi:competence protein ComEC
LEYIPEKDVSLSLEKQPSLFAAICFCFGVYIGDQGNINALFLGSIIAIFIVFCFYLESRFILNKYGAMIKSTLPLILLFTCGWLIISIDQPRFVPNHFLNIIDYDQRNIAATGVVTEIEKTAKGRKFAINVEETCQQKCYGKKTKTIVYYNGSKTINVLDRIQFQGMLLPKRPPNFRAFDYNKFLERNGIYYTMFVNDYSESITFINSANGEINYLFYRWKHSLLDVLKKYSNDELLLGLNFAMLLGDRTLLEDETVTLFSHTGAIHILAVSGFNVGIFMLFFVWLLDKIKVQTNFMKIFKMICVIGLVTVFTILVGGSPSVVRAGLLFIILYFVYLKKLEPNPLNYLGVIAIIILMFEPQQLYSLSFQFSFIAIISILVLYKPIQRLYKPKSIAMSYFWNIAAGSTAVQLMLGPLIVYHFGFLTTWYFINNYVAIPMVYVCVFGGLSVFAFNFFWTNFAFIISDFYNFIMKLAYYDLKGINELPISTLQNISWQWWELILIYIIIFLGIRLVFNFQKSLIRYAVVTLGLLLSSFSFGAYKNSSSNNMVVYSVSRGYTIDFINGTKVVCLKSDNIDETSLYYTTFSYRRYRGVSTVIYGDGYNAIDKEQAFFLNGENIFKAGNKWVYMIQKDDPRNWDKADIVILTKNVRVDDLKIHDRFGGTLVLLNEVKQDVRSEIKKGLFKKALVMDIIETGGCSIDL